MNTRNMFIPDDKGEQDYFEMTGNGSLTAQERASIETDIFENSRDKLTVLEQKENGISRTYQTIDEDFWETYFMYGLQKALLELKQAVKIENKTEKRTV